MIASNPRRPHPFQISDSEFSVGKFSGLWFAVEKWWAMDRNAEKEDCDFWHGPFETEAEAIAERDRRAGK